MHDDFSGLSLGGLPARIRKAAEQGKKGRDSVVCLLEYTSKIVERTCNEVVWISHWYQHVYDMRKFLTPPLMRLHSFENPIFRDWSLTGIDCDLTDESR